MQKHLLQLLPFTVQIKGENESTSLTMSIASTSTPDNIVPYYAIMHLASHRSSQNAMYVPNKSNTNTCTYKQRELFGLSCPCGASL